MHKAISKGHKIAVYWQLKEGSALQARIKCLCGETFVHTVDNKTNNTEVMMKFVNRKVALAFGLHCLENVTA